MTAVLAIETATDACSVALWVDGEVTERHAIAPRQHSQLLFRQLQDLLPPECQLRALDAIAYGSGPGSFTGLRIAASAAQGLAYATGVPVVAVSTLAALAQSALRQGVVSTGDSVLSTLDARVDEVYAALFRYEHGLAIAQSPPVASQPAQLGLQPGLQPWVSGSEPLRAVGDGCRYAGEFDARLRARLSSCHEEILPTARDIAVLAVDRWQHGQVQQPREVHPVYIRDHSAWKTLSEQGKRA